MTTLAPAHANPLGDERARAAILDRLDALDAALASLIAYMNSGPHLTTIAAPTAAHSPAGDRSRTTGRMATPEGIRS